MREYLYLILRKFLILRNIKKNNININNAILNDKIHIRIYKLININKKFLIYFFQFFKIFRLRVKYVFLNLNIIFYIRNLLIKIIIIMLNN